MIRLFKSDNLFSYFYLLVILVLVRGNSFLDSFSVPVVDQVLPSTAWISYLNSQFTFYSAVISSVILYIQAIYLNNIVSGHQVLYKASWLPALFLVMYSSIFPAQLLLSPQLISNLFLVIILDLIFHLYKTEKPLETIFDSGVLLGLSVLFTPECIIAGPLLLIAINFFRPFKLKEVMVCVMGFGLVIYFSGAILFLTDNLGILKAIPIRQYFRFNIFPGIFHSIIIYPLIVSGIFLVLSLFKLNDNFRKNNIKTRKSQQLMIVYLVLSLLVMGSVLENMKENVTLFAVPLSVFVAYFFLDNRKIWLKEVLGYILLVSQILFTWTGLGNRP